LRIRLRGGQIYFVDPGKIVRFMRRREKSIRDPSALPRLAMLDDREARPRKRKCARKLRTKIHVAGRINQIYRYVFRLSLLCRSDASVWMMMPRFGA